MEERGNGFMSEGIDQITAALCAFQAKVEQPKLNRENPYFKSRYVDLSGVLAAIQPLLSDNDMCVSQLLVGGDLITLLSHKSGQWLKSVCPIGTYKSQQDRGSAITYTKRYALCAMLGIAADTDDDGNSATDADKKSNGSAGNSAYTSEQLVQAMTEINAARDESEYGAVWAKWSKACPAMCLSGSDFYRTASIKIKQLRSNK